MSEKAIAKDLSKDDFKNKNRTRSVLLGAAFLMATSSVGPGFFNTNNGLYPAIGC